MQQLCHGFTRFIPTLFLETEMEPNNKCIHNTLFFPVLLLLFYSSYLGLVFLVNLSKGHNLVCHLRFNFLSLFTSVSEYLVFSLPIILPFCSFIFAVIVLSHEHDCLETG